MAVLDPINTPEPDPAVTTLLVDKANASYSETASVEVVGIYGTLTIFAGGTWSYERDTDKIKAAPLEGDEDVFFINVRDRNAVDGAEALKIAIKIRGENDAPTLLATTGASISATETTATVTELAASVKTNADATTAQTGAAGDDQRTSGFWTATDVDKGAKMRLFVGDYDIGLVDSGPLTFEGRYGDIIFKTDGTWVYELTARAEKIAENQMPSEVLDLTVVDEYGRISNVITITITVTGDNDAPEGLVATDDDNAPVADSGSVTESGFRTDAGTATIRTGSLTTPTLTLQTADTTLEARVDVSGGDTADVLGTPTVSGQLDAVDIDRVNS